jgi:hypothetical protein
MIRLELGIGGAFIAEDGTQRRATPEDIQRFFALLGIAKQETHDAGSALPLDRREPGHKLKRMSHEDQQCLKLGREIVRMIHDVRTVAGTDAGYARRLFTFPGGSVHLLLCNESELADVMERAASGAYVIEEATPPSQKN